MSLTPLSAEGLLKAVEQAMRPVVRLLLRSGVTFPVVSAMVRSLFVDVARRELLPDRASQTDSRVSLLTGVHRKELKRRRETDPALDEPVALTRTSAVIARWLGDPRFTAADGTPTALRRSGPAPSFEALCTSVTRDVRSRAILDELTESGIVEVEGDLVSLRADAFVPRDDEAAQLYYFARNAQDHLAAAEANLMDPTAPPFLERAVHYDKLSAAAASRLEATARQMASDMLLAFNRIALAVADEDDRTRPADAATRRVNLGVYLYGSEEQ